MTDLPLASLANPPNFASAPQISGNPRVQLNLLCIAWIDGNQLTRECFANAATAMQSSLVIMPFSSTQEFLDTVPPTVDLIVFHQHGDDMSDLDLLALNAATTLSGSPAVILTDGAPDSVRLSWERFPEGMAQLLSTRRTSLQMVISSLFLFHHGREIAQQPLKIAPLAAALPVQNPPESDGLTKRERVVLELVRQGYANKDIASDLQMSVSTVKAHVRNIMQKRRATNRTQLALGAERQLRSPSSS